MHAASPPLQVRTASGSWRIAAGQPATATSTATNSPTNTDTTNTKVDGGTPGSVTGRHNLRPSTATAGATAGATARGLATQLETVSAESSTATATTAETGSAGGAVLEQQAGRPGIGRPGLFSRFVRGPSRLAQASAAEAAGPGAVTDNSNNPAAAPAATATVPATAANVTGGVSRGVVTTTQQGLLVRRTGNVKDTYTLTKQLGKVGGGKLP